MKHNFQFSIFNFQFRWILLLLIFILHVFLRFYDIETRSPFGWDQVDNAWAAKNIIVDHQLPLLGPFAKGNSSGIRLGPAYYYLITPLYWLFKLDPIASGIFAGITSIFSFWTLFYITRKLFSFSTALMTVYINTIAFSGIMFDRVQWNVNFIPAVSLLIFYALYKIALGEVKYLTLLAISLGFFFSIHLTAIFFPVIILLILPFFPRTKKLLAYSLVSIPLFFVWLVPILTANLESRNSQSAHLIGYLASYYHGFHLTRMWQLVNDAFIQFEGFFTYSFLKPLKFILLPLFSFIYFFWKPSRKRFILCYLVFLWFLVPWFAFSLYSGEISDYYFSMNKFIALIVVGYLSLRVLQTKNWILRLAFFCFLLYYTTFNINMFFSYKSVGLDQHKKGVLDAIKERKKIEFTQGAADSYLYYIYTRK